MGNVDGTDETLEASPTATGEGAARAPVELHELGAGDVIGRYQITGVLGAGGMGRVYRARDPDLNRDLAIKVLRRAPGSGGSGGLEHRLLREAQAMARLKHANLATVYDVGAVRGEVFIAFEFIDGQTLAQWMRAPGRTTAEKLAALVAAGRGLEAAHSAGVIHRDFKPDNVLVARDGEVKVVDFGLARGVEAGGEAATASSGAVRDALSSDLTMTGSLLGTPAYMAPEQHKGLASDARADQFGFAVSAWEALYGERPFKGKSLEAIAGAILAGTIDPPPAGADVPAHVEKALRRAMSVDPAARFTDIGELLAVLSPRGRSRWPLAAAGAAVVLIGAGVVLLVTGGEARRNGTSYTNATEAEQIAITQTIFSKGADWKSCYLRAYRNDPSIGSGTVAIELEIGREGRVMGTRVASDEFGARGGIAVCIAANSGAWEFAPPSSGRPIKVVYPFRFEPPPAGVQLPPLPPPPPSPPLPPPTHGDLDKSRIRETIKADIGRVSSCYEEAIAADDSVADGTVSIEFEIGPDGRVKSTRIMKDDFAGKGVAACIAGKSFAWQFPRPASGGTVQVTYPFSFRRAETRRAPAGGAP